MINSVVDTDRIEGIRNKTGFVFDGVLGSRMIGLKKIISVFKESGDEQSLAVSDDELLIYISDSAGFEPDEVGVDPELFVIFEKKVIPLLIADLNILLYFLDEDPSLTFDDELVDSVSLKSTKKIFLIRILMIILLIATLVYSEILIALETDNYCEKLVR